LAIIKKYRSKVINIENPFPDLFVVSLKSYEKPFKYSPGQFLHLALDEYDPSSPWPESRCFSMQTNENEEYLKITYAVKGKFTQRMASELKEDKEVWLKLPYGELFSKEHNKEKIVFIAGGTGITPYLSLFTSKDFNVYYKNPKLYFGLRNHSYNLYKKELYKAQEINPAFKYFIFYQDIDGILNIEKIYNENNIDSTFFISGPPIMIKNFKNYLLNKNVNIENIKSDDWE
jgi:predicted ferric reductase